MKSMIELPYAAGLTLSNLDKALAKAREQSDGLAVQSILAQFFGDADQRHAITAIRAWTAGLFDSLDDEDALIDSGALGRLEVPVSVVFGGTDRYLNASLAAEIAGLFQDPSFHLVHDASHWPQYDQPEVVADLLKGARTTR